jgi:hypothetical protein
MAVRDELNIEAIEAASMEADNAEIELVDRIDQLAPVTLDGMIAKARFSLIRMTADDGDDRDEWSYAARALATVIDGLRKLAVTS